LGNFGRNSEVMIEDESRRDAYSMLGKRPTCRRKRGRTCGEGVSDNIARGKPKRTKVEKQTTSGNKKKQRMIVARRFSVTSIAKKKIGGKKGNCGRICMTGGKIFKKHASVKMRVAKTGRKG